MKKCSKRHLSTIFLSTAGLCAFSLLSSACVKPIINKNISDDQPLLYDGLEGTNIFDFKENNLHSLEPNRIGIKVESLEKFYDLNLIRVDYYAYLINNPNVKTDIKHQTFSNLAINRSYLNHLINEKSNEFILKAYEENNNKITRTQIALNNEPSGGSIELVINNSNIYIPENLEISFTYNPFSLINLNFGSTIELDVDIGQNKEKVKKQIEIAVKDLKQGMNSEYLVSVLKPQLFGKWKKNVKFEEIKEDQPLNTYFEIEKIIFQNNQEVNKEFELSYLEPEIYQVNQEDKTIEIRFKILKPKNKYGNSFETEYLFQTLWKERNA
ncbi:hypothetical protein FJO69_00610 [[Mycoplasma] falconis]|uniref:Lipoprotein n=1 Tax=[Mycoplasma] falconis TaxID=92403 RepID=A0A501XBX8_9BACT|nr:hypothetical protein [[Mycoplasma] falconis]TPE58095.1 hypothetical protein FJO69_00610 [[Mycoplasma] falconis]